MQRAVDSAMRCGAVRWTDRKRVESIPLSWFWRWSAEMRRQLVAVRMENEGMRD